MFTRKWLASSIALTGVVAAGMSGPIVPARAQVQVQVQAAPITVVPATGQGGPVRPFTPNGGRPMTPALTLASLVDKVEWDPAAQGTLLIVSPDETTAVYAPAAQNTAGVWVPAKRPDAPQLDAAGGYPLTQIDDYFSRKLVGVNSLSVLAPTTMAVLNDHRLPKPDPYSGMSPRDKARLLESSFTADQWQRAGSAEGIGAGDLTRDQRELYLSMLPDPFTVRPMTATTTENGFTANAAGDPVTLTAAQREGVRLSLQKKLDWTFQTGQNGNGRMSIGRSMDDTAPGGGPTYVLQTTNAMLGFGTGETAFGATLLQQVPSRAKPSQLPETIPSADAAIPLGEDATLGDLVHRLAQKTGLELYADPRYATRKLYVRGQSAQAGDLLRALPIAVTGTWRHVGPAYVLTDDIEGLGVRHARISDWLSQNALLAQARDEDIDGKLAEVPIDQVTHWSDSDPLRPDAALIEKLEAFQKQPPPPQANGIQQQGPFVPLNELPAAAQTIITAQIKGQQAAQERMAAQGANRVPMNIRADGVNVTTRTNPVYIVPGMASVTAQDIQGRMGAVALPPPFRKPASLDPPDTPKTLTFPEKCPVHVVLIAPHTEEEVVQAIQLAAQHGFSQVWVETPRNATRLLESAIQQGNARGVTVQAVVRPLQAIASDPPEARDRNLLGNTPIEYARHKQSEIRQLGIGEEVPRSDRPAMFFGGQENDASVWRNAAAVAHLLDKGDYLRCDDTAVQERITADLAKIAALPGLGGVVLHDATPPGYETVPENGGMMFVGGTMTEVPEIRDPLLQLGYTEAMRLACLRKNGIDPIDLSPLQRGDEINVSMRTASMQMARIGLPLFRDYGKAGSSTSYNGVSADKLGAGTALSRWNDLRASLDRTLVSQITTTLKSSAPRINLMSYAVGRPETGGGSWFGSIDDTTAPVPNAPAASAIPVAVPAGANNLGGRRNGPQMFRQSDIARAQSHTVFRTFLAAPATDDTPASFATQLRTIQFGLNVGYGWDGIVVDFSVVPMSQMARVLQAFPAAGE